MSMRQLGLVMAAVAVVLAAGAARADDVPPLPFSGFEAVPLDPKTPAPAAVLGYAPGAEITPVAETYRYLEALAAARPERVRLIRYGTSLEGRPLMAVAISSADNLRGFDAWRAELAAAADPRRDGWKDKAARWPESLAIPVFLMGAVHGDEISSTDALLAAAYYFAAGEDARARRIRQQAVVFVVPVQNPDGRARFVQHWRESRGAWPLDDRFAAEHDQPWPRGRFNHDLFDLNRDWLRATQPEIRGLIRIMREIRPLVSVDFHEMGGDETYFFSPEVEPFNPHLTPEQRADLEIFGRANAAAFDARGLPYFIRDVYDAFYPGYGASWPSYSGGIAMTYEQASPRGLVFRRRDGTTLTYHEAVMQHFLTAVSTADAAVAHRSTLWRHYLDYRLSALSAGRMDRLAAYVLPADGDRDAADRLARLLAFHGIEVERLTRQTDYCGRRLAAGAYVVTLEQPEARRVRVLLDRRIPMDPDFLARQQARRVKGLPDEIYDVTAWSLPLMMNVETLACSEPWHGGGERLSAEGEEAPARQAVRIAGDVRAVVVPWGSLSAVRLLAEALKAGLVVRAADEAFTAAGRRFPAGSLILPLAPGEEAARGRLAAALSDTGAPHVALSATWVDEGPSFGSRKSLSVPAPRVVLAWDRPTQPTSAGGLRHIIERRFRWPVIPVRGARLADLDLARYDVLLLPDGRYGGTLDEAFAARLKAWVENGGVVVGFAGALDWLAAENVGLLPSRNDLARPEGEGQKPEKGERPDGDAAIADEDAYRARIGMAEPRPPLAAGALMTAVVDGDHWLAAGLKPTVHPLAMLNRIWRPLAVDEGRNVIRYAPADRQPASGVLWPDGARLAAFHPYAMIARKGAGFVIAITEDQPARAYQDGLDLLIANAIFRAPQHSGRLR
ncbi:MAG: deacylase/carboxypeptidase superfamily protein [Rhodothalassiaceae bacterium]|nr:MAG: deacylase/carboxypeptidase superfamily protein [Rhodothalassiaceae bacterium]